MKQQIKKFEDLRIWQESHDLTINIYKITKIFPKDELYGIISQLRRASSSVPANIVEGFYRHSTKELINFLFNARGSTGEVIYFLLLSRDLGYLKQSQYVSLRERYELLAMSINALINSLNKK
jgi:four helix bundle protein